MNTHEKRDFIAKKCKQFRELLPDGVTLTDIRQTWTVEQCNAWLREQGVVPANYREGEGEAPAVATEAAPALEAAAVIEATATTKKTRNEVTSVDAAIKALIAATTTKATVDEDAVRALIAEALAKHEKPTRIEIVTPASVATVDKPHPRLAECVQWLATGANLLFVGPSGCGKTHLAEQCAAALKLDFGLIGAVTMPHEIVGYCDASGVYRDTPVSRTFREGGLACLDEIDAGSEQALLAANATLANGFMAQGSTMVRRHDSWRCIATANTAGTGATMTYNGRTKLDGATVDRFVIIELDYDAAVEKQLAGGNSEWLALCRKAREVAKARGLHAAPIGTYRAIATGARMLATTGAALKATASALLARGGLTLDMIGV